MNVLSKMADAVSCVLTVMAATSVVVKLGTSSQTMDSIVKVTFPILIFS